MTVPRVCVVVPAYNEAPTLEAAVREIVEGLRTWQRPFDVHIVENGSTDGTRTIAERLASEVDEVVVHTMPVADYGEALRTGLLQATGGVAVIFDVDYYDLDFLKEALGVLDQGDDPRGPVIVVGSKRAPGARDTRPFVRRAATGVFSTIIRTLFELGVSDTHGMKVLRRDVLDSLMRQCLLGADLFDTELLIRAVRAGWRVAEVPVTVVERRPPRTSIATRVPRTLWGIVRLRAALGRRAR